MTMITTKGQEIQIDLSEEENDTWSRFWVVIFEESEATTIANDHALAKIGFLEMWFFNAALEQSLDLCGARTWNREDRARWEALYTFTRNFMFNLPAFAEAA